MRKSFFHGDSPNTKSYLYGDWGCERDFLVLKSHIMSEIALKTYDFQDLLPDLKSKNTNEFGVQKVWILRNVKGGAKITRGLQKKRC